MDGVIRVSSGVVGKGERRVGLSIHICFLFAASTNATRALAEQRWKGQQFLPQKGGGFGVAWWRRWVTVLVARCLGPLLALVDEFLAHTT